MVTKTKKAAPEPKFHKIPKSLIRAFVPVKVEVEARKRMAETGLRAPQYLTALMCRDVGLNPADFGVKPTIDAGQLAD